MPNWPLHLSILQKRCDALLFGRGGHKRLCPEPDEKRVKQRLQFLGSQLCSRKCSLSDVSKPSGSTKYNRFSQEAPVETTS